MAYLKKVFAPHLKAHLEAIGTVLNEEPKWCGKTTTAKQMTKNVISMQDTDLRDEYITTSITKP